MCFEVKNKTIIGLKSISLLAPIELKRVKNKTIIGLKYDEETVETSTEG